MQTNIAAIGRINRVDESPLRTVQQTRTDHFSAFIQRQVRFPQMTYCRTERQPIQILDDADFLCVRGRSPIALECAFKSGLDVTFTKYFVVIFIY
jgi:hypothetical protein